MPEHSSHKIFYFFRFQNFFLIWLILNEHSVKKVPGFDHSKIPLKEIVQNISDAKLAPLSSILTCSSSAICHLDCSQCSMLSVYLKCVSRFFQWMSIEQRIRLKFCIKNGMSCVESLKILQKAYGESTLLKTCAYEWYSAFKSGRNVWWKISLAFIGHQRLQLKLTSLKWRKNRQLNKEYYLSVIKRLIEEILRKRADLWKENSWILHHDNATSHKAFIANEFLAKNSTNIIEQPPYSPDMAPPDFFLFPKLKLLLRGTRFQSKKDIKENSRQ